MVPSAYFRKEGSPPIISGKRRGNSMWSVSSFDPILHTKLVYCVLESELKKMYSCFQRYAYSNALKVLYNCQVMCLKGSASRNIFGSIFSKSDSTLAIYLGMAQVLTFFFKSSLLSKM